MKRTGERAVPDKPRSLRGIPPIMLQIYTWASHLTKGHKVVEVACGVGYGSRLLSASEYRGFDISSEAIQYAVRCYTTDTVTFQIADACAMPASIERSEVLVSFDTIEHLPDPEAFLNWCSSHTDMLLISTPIRGSFRRSHYHLFEYRLIRFKQALKRHFLYVMLMVQKSGGIIYPCLDTDRGVAIGLCWPK